ncbi:Serine carboxypeptidase-like 19 isoform H [Glycine soja]|uniref:Serine carboxypeptidase-like 19 isoform H n=1 Tax=Glycine soja TaxID=3848 RepID=A0A445K4U1_GLYSO|nr:Serine carboxypeptidase-like 19 isoform H [Glycine soja]
MADIFFLIIKLVIGVDKEETMASPGSHIVVLAFVLLISSKLAECHNIVRFLPGFQGPLPFLLETGYVEVGETEAEEHAELFYYFIESENDPKGNPLLLWLTGGPGCSAFSGLVFEIGPLTFKNEEYNGSLPNLTLKPQSWTKVSSIIFVDLPAGTGFSYPKTERAVQQSSSKLVRHAHQFIRKWLIDHPEFLSNEVYIAGDSYCGIPVPVIVQEISNGIARTNKRIKLKRRWYATMDIHPDEILINSNNLPSEQSLQKNCRGEYRNIDPRNALCLRDMQSYEESISGIETGHVLAPLCDESDLRNDMEVTWRRSSLAHKTSAFFSPRLTLPPLYCRSHAYVLCSYWANDDNVRKALHVRKGSIGKWTRCNDDLKSKFNADIPSSFQYHVNLSRKGYRSLIYSGDHDMVVPFLATQAWIRSLNYSIVSDWRQWYYDGQVAGYAPTGNYTRTYSNRMTFATVKGGGHTAPEYKPEECLAMFSRWISNMPL